MVGWLAHPYDPQSYAGGSSVFLAGSTIPDWSAGEGSDEMSTIVFWARDRLPAATTSARLFVRIVVRLQEIPSG